MRTTNELLKAIGAEANSLETKLAEGKPLQARDWAGFFAALSQFVATILPLIIPLFSENKDPNA